MRRSVVASALLAALLVGSLGAALTPAMAAPLTDQQRATLALTFLHDAQRADGSIDGSIGETADTIVAAADAHYDPSTLTACSGSSALQFLAADSDRWATDAGKTAKAILAVNAAHLDASSFRGRNLLGRLTALYHATTGAYGGGTTFEQSLAILAVHSSGRAVSGEAVAHLAGLQDTDGSWNYTAAANSTAGDTNSTAIALIALAAAGDHSRDATALAYLRSQQLADGGFPYQNSSTWGPPASDPDSDSLVLQALIATGQDPTATGWSKGANNVVTHLRSTQAPNGGFAFPGNPGPDAFTTSQATIGLTGVPYGEATEFEKGAAVPASPCASPSPSASPAASASASASASAESSVAGATASHVVTPPPTVAAPSTPANGGGGAGLLAFLVIGISTGGALISIRRRNPAKG